MHMSQLRTAMRILKENGHFTSAAALLLAAVSKVPLAMIERAVVLSKRRNWLHFPWYPKSRGGAFVLGEKVYVSDHFVQPNEDPSLRFLLLLAHEVGHLPHADQWGISPWGRAKFVLWATGHYARSSLLNGRHGHRKARIEQEAERGRWVLSELIRINRPSLEELLRTKDGMAAWLSQQRSMLKELHAKYPGWTLTGA